jgi:hypothetical protein
MKKRKITMLQIMNNPRYRGKHVIVIANKIFTAKTGTQVNKVLDKLEKKYPKATPAITYIPKSDSLILCL